MHVQDVEEHYIRVAAFTAQHMTKSVPAVIKLAILPEFAGADRNHISRYHSVTALNPQTMPFAYSYFREITYSYMYNITGNKADPPSRINVQMVLSARAASLTYCQT